MICGIGIDIVEVARIVDIMQRHEEHFLATIFTSVEISKAPKGEQKYAYYAARWAAKEAVAKALGTGIGEKCAWQDIEVQKYITGEPYLVLTGSAAETAKQKGARIFHLSLSHEKKYACANVIAEG